MHDKETLLADEELFIRTSGEIPEVAFYSATYYLAEDPEGPGLSLTEEDLQPLKDAVVARYRDIILRDLIPENRHKSLYRGPVRSAANWQRCVKYCLREKRAIDEMRVEVAAALERYITREIADAAESQSPPTVNCSVEVLQEFAAELQLECSQWPQGWQDLCTTGC